MALATTGDELVAPGDAVPRGGVVDANLIGLTAQAEAAGAVVCGSAHAPDDRDASLAAFSDLLDGSPDVLVTVGGISVGAHDHVGPALQRLGARWELRGVAMRPGHPVGVAVVRPDGRPRPARQPGGRGGLLPPPRTTTASARRRTGSARPRSRARSRDTGGRRPSCAARRGPRG